MCDFSYFFPFSPFSSCLLLKLKYRVDMCAHSIPRFVWTIMPSQLDCPSIRVQFSPRPLCLFRTIVTRVLLAVALFWWFREVSHSKRNWSEFKEMSRHIFNSRRIFWNSSNTLKTEYIWNTIWRSTRQTIYKVGSACMFFPSMLFNFIQSRHFTIHATSPFMLSWVT